MQQGRQGRRRGPAGWGLPTVTVWRPRGQVQTMPAEGAGVLTAPVQKQTCPLSTAKSSHKPWPLHAPPEGHPEHRAALLPPPADTRPSRAAATPTRQTGHRRSQASCPSLSASQGARTLMPPKNEQQEAPRWSRQNTA